MRRLHEAVTGGRERVLRVARSPQERAVWLAVLGALALVVVVRTWIPYGQVFYDGEVMLAANDPYAFRYFVDRLLESGLHPFNPWDLAAIPEEIREHDVTFIVTMWAATVVFGGDATTGGAVLAWYPVVAGVATVGMAGLVATWLTDDRRVGLVALVLLALTPAHAYRTMLGFGDHDAFGYVVVMVTATALVWLLRADARGTSWRDLRYGAAVGLAGAGMVAASLGWRGGPILLAPIAVYAVVAPVVCVKAGRSPAATNRGLLLGLVAGAALGVAVHVGLGWGQLHRGLAPLLLCGLVVALVGIGEAIHRAGVPWPVTMGPIPLVAIAWFGGLWTGHPLFSEPLARFWRFASGPDSDVGERVSLFATPETAVLMFGLLLLVAIPVMLWVLVELTWPAAPGWLLVSSYAWGFLVLASFRYRWSALAALFVVVFGAVGVLYLAHHIGVVRPVAAFADGRGTDRPSWDGEDLAAAGRAAAVVAVVVVLVMGMGLVQVPATMNAITHDETTHETATVIAGYAHADEWADAETYVFTEWGSNRVINYHVSGDSRSYSFSRSHYRSFVSGNDPAEWTDHFEDRVGFVMVQNSRYQYPTDSMQVRLNDRYGSAGDGVPGLSRYRLLHVSDDGSTTVFAYVPGATITGTGPANATVSLETDVVVSGEAFTYTRTVETDADGEFAVTVPYPGQYATDVGSVAVDEEAVLAGSNVSVG